MGRTLRGAVFRQYYGSDSGEERMIFDMLPYGFVEPMWRKASGLQPARPFLVDSRHLAR